MAYWWDEGQDAGAIPADAAEPAPEARAILGARDGPHRGSRARARVACPSLARAAATAVAAPACVFFGGVFPRDGVERDAPVSTPSPRR